MRILILTQNESLYLPRAFAKVLRELAGEVVCIVSAPAMSTHKGVIRGIVKHVGLFGIKNSFHITMKIIAYRILDLFKKGNGLYSIKSVARSFALPFHEIVKVNTPEFHQIIDLYSPDLLISMSCPQIIGKKVRARFLKGCINVHGAPLPKYRGLMPAFWALRNNEQETAVSVHDLADKLDNGDILLQMKVPITKDDTWDSLVRKTKDAGADALTNVVRLIVSGTVTRKQNSDEEATYFSFPTQADRKVFLAMGRRFF
jgi:methionyl-tRNA formyltransferase